MSKFFYKGMSLSKYCDKNNLNYSNICYDLNKVLKVIDIKPQDIEKLVEIIINNKIEKIEYKNLKFKEFCKKNDLDYASLSLEIIKLVIFENLEVDEAIVEKAIKSNLCDIKNRCYINGIKYPNFLYRLKSISDNEKYSSLTGKEKIDLALKQSGKRTIYEGMALGKYCEKNHLNHKTIKLRIKKLKDSMEYGYLDEESIIKLAVSEEIDFKKFNICKPSKYHYQGVSLSEYCNENDIKYYSVVKRIISMQKSTSLDIDEIIDYVVKTYKKRDLNQDNQFFYNGEDLQEYCNRNNYKYDYLVAKIRRKRKEDNQDLNQIVKEVVDKYKFSTYSRSLKYTYDGMALSEYCSINNLKFSIIRDKIRNMYFSDNYKEYSLEELAKIVIEKTNKYQKKKKLKYIQSVISNRELGQNEIEEFCKIMGVDYDTVMLLSKNLKINQAINMVWCFYDLKLDNKRKSISKEKVKEVYELVNKVKNNELEAIELRDLVRLYRSKFYDTREILLDRFNSFIYGSVINACAYYNVNVDDATKEEFLQESRLIFLETLDNIVDLKYNGRIVTYISKRVKGYVRAYIKDYKKNNDVTHLEQTVGDGNMLIDILENKENVVEDENEINFDKYFSNLSSNEAKFMLMIYKENYSYEDLASLYNVNVEKVISKEKQLLKKIKINVTYKISGGK